MKEGARIGVHSRDLRAPFEVGGHKFFAYNTLSNPHAWKVRDDYRFVQGLYGELHMAWVQPMSLTEGSSVRRGLPSPELPRTNEATRMRKSVEGKGIPWDEFHAAMTEAVLRVLDVQETLEE